MLAYFMNFSVPGVADVVVFRDHADAQQFYILNDRPRVVRDSKTGSPLFSFTLFSRNIEIAYASAAPGQPVESQLGSLSMTVDLSVDEADMTRIREYLASILKAERARPSAYNSLYKVATSGLEPRVGYVDWLNGTVRLDIIEGLGTTFKRSSSPETTPTLHGTNKAALWATFGSEGAQLVWGSLQPPAGTGGQTTESALEANITYKLEALARLPGIRVSVTANSKGVYEELRKRKKVFEQVGNTRWTYPQVSELTKKLVETRVINIVWDDYGIPASDPAADQIKQQLEQAVMGVVTNQIVGLFFKAFEFKGLADADLGTTFTHSLGGKPGSRLWLDDFNESFEQDISFSMEKSQNFRFPAAPQTSLLSLILTKEERARLVRVVDVGSPEVRVMTVQVDTNAEFKTDRIANITATLSYRQFDTLVNDWVEASESFVFRTGEEAFAFRTRLARDSEGRLIDLYNAKAQINYIGSSQSPPAIELTNISERALTFSYDRLGYVKVDVQAGDIDWTQIKDVFIDLVYEPAQNEPDAKGMVRLTEQALKGQWSTSKHGRKSNGYKYTTRYKFVDGREENGPGGSDDRNTLVIHDSLVDKIRRSFDVELDPTTVAAIALKVRYENPPDQPHETRHLFTETGSWEYVRPVQKSAPLLLKYAYDIQYKDGESDRISWAPIGPDEDLPEISARRFKFPIIVDGEGLDWTKWRVAMLEIAYRDDRRNYLRQETLRINEANPFQMVEILAFVPDAREFQFHATIVPRDGGAPVEIPPEGGMKKHSGALLLDQLV